MKFLILTLIVFMFLNAVTIVTKNLNRKREENEENGPNCSSYTKKDDCIKVKNCVWMANDSWCALYLK